jgi:hypothetical protein
MFGEVGSTTKAVGSMTGLRLGRNGQLLVGQMGARYSHDVISGNMYSLTLTATTTTIAAGNIVAAAAAASTQFALFNPANSGKALVLLKFGIGTISGTAPAGPVFHGVYSGVPTIASIGGTIINNYSMTGGGSVALAESLAAGSALTGAPAVKVLRIANFSVIAGAAASTAYGTALEVIDGGIVLAPGTGWAPLHSAAGTTVLHAYSISWIEVSLPV